MARKKRGEGPNKSEFIRGILNQNSGAKLGDVNEAWKAAGHSGLITPTLYYQVKSKLGLTKGRKRRRRRVATESKGPSPADAYLAIERELDHLVAKAAGLGDQRLAEAIRTARRRASSKLI